MEEYLMSFREVIPNQSNSEKWKEITLNLGGTHSTLQDIKVPEKAGGHSYTDFTKVHSRNRFLYWRTSHDILELSEISLDYNLIDNNVRYKFADSPILFVGIYEVIDFVVILVATVGSIHRLNLPHPDTFHKINSDVKPYSIFHEASSQMANSTSTFHILGTANHTNTQIPHAATCWLLSRENEALFALAYQSSLFLYSMNQMGQIATQELKQHNFVPRIFTNITGALRGKRSVNDGLFVTSLTFDTLNDQTYLYALYRDDQIRMWSTKTGSCIASVNCLQDGIEPRPQGPQTNLLRKASPTTLCAFLCHSSGSEFVTIEITGHGKSSNVSMNRMYMVAAPEYDLVDFEIIDSRIWGLWCNSNGEFNVSSHFLTPGYDCVNWITAALEPPPDRFSINIDRGMDPRHGYCNYIFHPGKFQKSVIIKALSMFRRTNILASDIDMPIAILKDRVCQAIENETLNEIKDYEICDEEYIEISSRLWERFYSCCEQYHTKSCQPIGLVQINSSGGLCIVKKNMFSLLRHCEVLEHLMLAGDNAKLDDLTGLIDNQNLCSDLIQLVSILSFIEGQLSDEIKIDIDKKLYQLHLPNEVISKMISDIDEYDEFLSKNVINAIHNRIQLIKDLPATIIALLDMFNIDKDLEKSIQDYSKLGEFTKDYLALGNLFGSNYGISILTESLRQTALIRYSLSRNTLILQMLLIELFTISTTQMEIIRSRCMPQTIVFVQAYYVMVWICETTVNPAMTANANESSIQRLSVLQFPDSRNYIVRSLNCMSLLELFLRGKGASVALSMFVENTQDADNMIELQWHRTLLPMVTNIAQLIWAVSGKFTFGEWLIGSCQHILILEYVRLLNSWCEWNNCSRHFILGVSLLDNGEHKKAFNLFMQADRGVTTESFLIDKILKNNTNLTTNDAVAEYYLKVIELFEQYSAFDCVILMAKAAINVLKDKDLKLAMFQSIIFSKHLALEHYEEAYESLIHNAEPLRRKDCLCQLIVCLFQEKRLDLLMHFPYIGLQEEVENIIESRARAMAVGNNNHYDFLYSFYITKGNMRKASSIMYERAMRYLLECDSIGAIESRYHCLLGCINALHLVDKKYAWIVKPAINDENNMEIEDGNAKQKVTVLEIKDLRKELILTEAILLVSKYKNEISGILHAGPNELVGLLSSLNLYTAAIRLSKHYDLNITPVLESITLACINIASQESDEIWKWLSENDIIDLSIRDSAVDTAWNFLKNLLENNEKHDSTILHKSIARKIISCGVFLPQWLYSSYKSRNTSELINLFVSNGRLIEGCELAVEYVNAMLTGGIEYFNLKNTLHSTLPPLCFPINTIDLLLHGLKLNKEQEYKQCHDELTTTVKKYIETVQRISRDKIHYEYRTKLIG